MFTGDDRITTYIRNNTEYESHTIKTDAIKNVYDNYTDQTKLKTWNDKFNTKFGYIEKIERIEPNTKTYCIEFASR